MRKRQIKKVIVRILQGKPVTDVHLRAARRFQAQALRVAAQRLSAGQLAELRAHLPEQLR